MKFCTAVNCMDGRTQEPVVRFLKERFKTDYVDMITEAGPNKILSEGTDRPIIDAILERIGISVEKHGSKSIAVVGHFDCAGNPASKETNNIHTIEALKVIQKEFPGIETVGLWVDENSTVSIVKNRNI